jgi:hypothetical protein
LNTKRIGMDTKENVFLTLGAFWDAVLRGKIDEALSREFAPQDRPEACNTVVVVSVNKRAERDITKEFLGLDVDWSVIGEKLERLVFRQLIHARIAQFWISFARDSLILLLGPIVGFQRAPNAGYRNDKLVLIPYEVHHLVEIQVWLSEKMVQECGKDVRGNARAPAADVFGALTLPKIRWLAGALLTVLMLQLTTLAISLSDSEADRFMSCSWDLWDCASCGATGVAL